MRTWTLEDARLNLPEILKLALANKPQRLGQGDDGVVVVSAREYAALAFARDLIAFVQRSGAHGGVSPLADAAQRESDAR